MEIKEYARTLAASDSAVREVIEQRETLWLNPRLLPFEVVDGVTQLVVSDEDIQDAEARLARFAPYIRKC